MAGKAVLVIDMLEDFIRPEGALYVGEEAAKIKFPIARLLQEERKSGAKVIYLCDNHFPEDIEFRMFPAHCINGTRGASTIPELEPQEGDTIIFKRRFSAFCGTELDITLREFGVKELLLTGVCTNICVLYTAAEARNLNYSVSVRRDCVSSFDMAAHEFALGEMKRSLGVEVF